MKHLDPGRLYFFLQDMACATWITSGDGYVWDIPDWCALTGLTAEEAEGDGWASALHHEDRPSVMAAWAAALANPRPYSVIYRVRLASGTYQWINARAVPVLRADGRAETWIGLCFDLGPCANPSSGRIEAQVEHIRSRHLRAARAMIGISVIELAAASKISSSTIRRIESEDAPVKTRRSVLERLVATYRTHGIVFYDQHGTVSVGDLGGRSSWLPEWFGAARVD